MYSVHTCIRKFVSVSADVGICQGQRLEEGLCVDLEPNTSRIVNKTRARCCISTCTVSEKGRNQAKGKIQVCVAPEAQL
jgi:hypothetical protein